MVKRDLNYYAEWLSSNQTNSPKVTKNPTSPEFTIEDLAPVTGTNDEPKWHRNVRNALQRRKIAGEIISDGKANYRIDRPYIWRMIKEAINSFERQITYSQIKKYINNRWPNVNPATVNAQIIILTVNHESRIHYPENKKKRLINSNSPYDLLFNTGEGQVIKYNPDEHGVWEIFKDDRNKLKVRQIGDRTDKTTYTPSDITWFKNVTNATSGEAYLGEIGNEFVIHFLTRHKTNALSPAKNEIILIYQKVNDIPAFTHLVTPVDNRLIDEKGSLNYRKNYRFGRLVKVIAKTERDSIIPVSSTLWQRLKFSGITQGNACKIENIKNIENIDLLKLDIWRRFSKHFTPKEQQSVSITDALIKELESSNPDISVKERELRLVSHLVKERNSAIVKKKKQDAITANTFQCEVCSFSFPETYKADFIECHHKTPIAQTGVRETTLDDLALVCANCHRMLHTKFDGCFLSIDELRERINSLKSSEI